MTDEFLCVVVFVNVEDAELDPQAWEFEFAFAPPLLSVGQRVTLDQNQDDETWAEVVEVREVDFYTSNTYARPFTLVRMNYRVRLIPRPPHS